MAPMALNETLTGEVCHIEGAKPGSARYNSRKTDVERHAYNNLILMCPTHHTVIDDDEEAYSVKRLHKIKAEHEERSAPIAEPEASRVAQAFVQSVITTGQSGGISAHTVNASSITVQSGPSTNHLTHQRQMQAVEHLWQVIRNLSSEFGLVVYIDTIMLAEEIDGYFRRGEHRHVMDCVREYADINAALNKLKKSGALDAAKERPFVTHRLWSVFFVTQAVYARNALLLTNSYKEHKLVNWRQDTGTDQLLRAILPAQTVEHLKTLSIGGLRGSIDQLENQFLAEAGMNRPEFA
jgi:hypothetical protein